jgi:hypothetical protein
MDYDPDRLPGRLYGALYREPGLGEPFCRADGYDFAFQGVHAREAAAVPVGKRPSHVDGSLWGIVKSAGRYIRDYVQDNFGFDLSYKGLKVRSGDLSGTSGFSGGRVLGLYTPQRREARIEKRLPFRSKLYVTMHELAHYAQDRMGKLSDYFRKYGETTGRYLAEREANYMASGALHRYSRAAGCYRGGCGRRYAAAFG